MFKIAKKTYGICEIPGDGIGPEIISATKEVLQAAQDASGFQLRYHLAPCGDRVKKETGTAIPKESIETFKKCDAALKGPVGDTVRDFVVAFRQQFDLYANVRPAISISVDMPTSFKAGHKPGDYKREL